MTPPKQPQNLDQAFQQLQHLVDQFESGQISLEDSPKRLTEGLQLARFIKKRLGNYHQKLEEIKVEFKHELAPKNQD